MQLYPALPYPKQVATPTYFRLLPESQPLPPPFLHPSVYGLAYACEIAVYIQIRKSQNLQMIPLQHSRPSPIIRQALLFVMLRAIQLNYQLGFMAI